MMSLFYNISELLSPTSKRSSSSSISVVQMILFNTFTLCPGKFAALLLTITLPDAE